jgi:uncharacterized membrane protein
MIWETREWMAKTPISALQRVQPYFGPIAGVVLGIVVLIAWLVGQGYPVAIIVIPLMVWSGILILQPQLPEEKRIVLTMVGVGLALTFLVEVVVLEGDISRMNTVFKFYLQVWELFSIAAAAAVAWTLMDIPAWLQGWRRFWSLGLGLLVFAAALYPISAAPAKIRDRMSEEAPHILDGIGFLPYVDNYYDMGKKVDLAEEYRAIQWMQRNVQGSPVIVEANIPEYRWGSRYTIYTGLPGVLGWNWHQRQQRVVTESSDVSDRALDILNFYLTKSIGEAQDFLERYGVKYVIVGQLERIYFDRIEPCSPIDGGNSVSCDLRGWPWGMTSPDVHPSECEPMDLNTEGGPLSCPTYGLDKFAAMRASGDLMEVYRDGETVIYEVPQ